MSELPCICCDNGDPLKHVICETCEDILHRRTETFESMVDLVKEVNELCRFGIGSEYEKEAITKTLIVYNLLCDIKIEKKNATDTLQ